VPRTCVSGGDDVGVVVAQHIQQREIGLAHLPARRKARRKQGEQWEGATADTINQNCIPCTAVWQGRRQQKDVVGPPLLASKVNQARQSPPEPARAGQSPPEPARAS
jgi:hypothetical protein